MLSDIFLDPAKRALHPDSPVLNSGWDIKLPFFAIVAGWFACMLVGAWLPWIPELLNHSAWFWMRSCASTLIS